MNDWKLKRCAPLLDAKLTVRKELVEVQELEQDEPGRRTPRVGTGGRGAQAAPPTHVAELQSELAALQKKIDDNDVSTDSFLFAADAVG